MLTIVTPAANQNLVTLADVKTALAIAGAAEDASLAILIAQASASIAQHCNRVFMREEVVETFRSNDLRSASGGARGAYLMVSRFPIAVLTSISEGGKELAGSAYSAEINSGMIERICSDRSAYWSGDCIVTYAGGYGSERPVPPDLQGAAIAMVAHLRLRALRDPMIRSDAVEGIGSITYEVPRLAIPDFITDVIESYRSPSIG